MNLSINSIINKITLSLLILSGIVYVVFDQSTERIFFISFSLFFLLFHKKRKLTRLYFIDIIYLLFIASFVIDSLLYLSFQPIIYGSAMLFVYYYSRNIDLKSIYNSLNIFYKYLIFSMIAFLIIPILFKGIGFINYKGIFNNPNTLGIFASSITTILSSKILSNKIENKKTDTVLIVLYLISCFFVIVSSCRIAFGVVFLQLLISAIILIKQRGLFSKISKTKLLYIILVILALICILLFTNIFDLVNNSLISKFIHLIESGDLSNGRRIRWELIWNYTGIFGSGNSVILTTPHNVYFGLMNDYGKINSILFFVFIITYLVYSFRLAFSSSVSSLKFYPLMSGICFFCVSLTESYLMTIPMINMYLCVPVILNKEHLQTMIKKESHWQK